jgi:hypothetical protein
MRSSFRLLGPKARVADATHETQNMMRLIRSNSLPSCTPVHAAVQQKKDLDVYIALLSHSARGGKTRCTRIEDVTAW